MIAKSENINELLAIVQQFFEMDTQEFVLKNPAKLSAENLRFVAEQIAARKKAKTKLPTWFNNPKIIFPPALSVEQASSEITAKYKSELISGNSLIDLTGGMGIDCCFFVNRLKSVIYIEKKEILVESVKRNFEQLGIKSIKCINDDSLEFIQNFDNKVDWIYIDPARRDNAQNKVFRIEDCEPNILEIKDKLFEKTDNILIKFSPLLDIKLAIEQLANVVEVQVVAVENEVKELLFILKKEINQTPKLTAVNLPNQTFQFTYEEEVNQTINYSKPSTYIYEPNAAVLKSGAFKSVANHYKLNKIAPNSHLYTSDFLVNDFVGRSFKCEAVCKFDKKEIAKYLPQNQANISVRNFPMKPDEISKKLGFKDGGEVYLFFTEDFEKKKIVLVCKKV